MELLQLAGYSAFIVASLLLGMRLVLLWHKTRQWPELSIGISFLSGGFLGYLSWLVLSVLRSNDASAEAIKSVALIGLAFTVLGALSNGVGTALIFRASQRWARLGVACAGIGMAGSWTLFARVPADGPTEIFWYTILIASTIYLWGAIEAISLGRVLRKRARLGLAEPLVADRIMNLGVCSSMVVVSIAISYSAQLNYGQTPPGWTATLASGALLVGAGAIWLGFFPPKAYRIRIESEFEANRHG